MHNYLKTEAYRQQIRKLCKTNFNLSKLSETENETFKEKFMVFSILIFSRALLSATFNFQLIS